MTHARIPDFTPAAIALPAATARVLPGDPVLAAIDAHAEAWAMYWCAPTGRAAEIAEDTLSASLEDLLATPCASRFGALALIRHLRWLIDQEAITTETADLCGRLVLAREADLSRFAGSDLPPDHLPAAAPSGRLAPAISASLPPALCAPRAVPVLRRVLRAAGLAGDALAIVVLIAGGVLAYGYLPPL